MPNFEGFAEWVLDNLYLAGAVTGAVLLILLVVLLLMLRGKRTSTTPALEDMFGQSNRPTKEMDLHTPLDARAALGPDDMLGVTDEAVTEGAPDTPPQTPRPSPLPAVAVPFRPIPGAGDEHVRSVIMGLLEGRGDLTGSELRRIELLRPEKVLVALDQMESSLGGRGKESQRARLLKLRQYAELLAPNVAPDTPAPAVGTSEEPPEYVGVEPEAGPPGANGSGASSKSDVLEAVFELDHDLPLAPQEPESPAALPATDSSRASRDSADWLPGVVSEARSSRPETAAPLDLEPVIGEAVWTAPDSGIETFADEQMGLEEESWDEVRSAAHQTDVSEVEVEHASPTEASVEPEDDTAAPAAAGTPGTAPSLDALDLRIETAEDVLSMDASEREHALDFLKPAELGRLFASTEDPRLKLSIIDILSHEPDSDSIDALDTCLDDPDPAVQLYALEAAERMLSMGDRG